MNFLLVGTNPENTGAATHFVALAQALAAARHRVHVIAHPGGPIARELAGAPGVRVYAGQFRNVLDVRAYVLVVTLARHFRPDWLIGNFGKEYWPLLALGRALRIPVALFRHRTPPMKHLSAWFVPRLAQRFFAVSTHARQAYLDRGIPAARVQVLYNPVNMEHCRFDLHRRTAMRASLGIDGQAIVLGYAGRMQRGKGVFTLLEAATAAMARNQQLHCLWLGDGPDATAVRELARCSVHADRHHFIGWTDDVQSWYSVMSMLAFPSIAMETFGRVSVEAQASGVPVLGSNLGGIPETMDAGRTGLLLPPGDPVAWCDAILALCDPAIREPMAAAARPFVEQHFSGASIAAQLVSSLAAAGAATTKHHHPGGVFP